MTMSDQLAIEIEGVDKIYTMYPNLHTRLRDTFGRYKKRDEIPDFAALKDINLSIKKGERVGLVGRNGAGKTTLLKLLIGHIQPTFGNIRVNGSVQAMIHTNMGSHLHFTGRENIVSALIYNNFNAEQIAEAMADVEDFTELGEYLDQPVKNYSLGMQSRLHFAISSAVKPDILIVDEMLGAGDTYFIRKSNRRMQRLIDSGCTLLLVSHNTQQVLRFCERGIWLRGGQVYYDAPVRNVVNSYDVYIERETEKRHAGIELSEKTDKRSVQSDAPEREFLSTLGDGKKVFRWPSRDGLKVDAIDILVDGKNTTELKTGDDVELFLSLKVDVTQSFSCRYLITVWDQKGLRVARIENEIDSFQGIAGETRDVRINLSPFLIGAGQYTLSCSIYDLQDYKSTSHGSNSRLDFIAHAVDFTVSDQTEMKAPVYINAQWRAS